MFPLLTVWVGVEFNGDHEGALFRYSILEESCILAGGERSFAVSVRIPAILYAKLRHALIQRKTVVMNVRKILPIQLPAIDKLEEDEEEG